MLDLREAPVIDQALTPYVAGYALLRLSSPQIHEKEILPWPGCFLLFADQVFDLDGRTFPVGCLRGIHDAPSRLRWRNDDLEIFTVRFAPYGLRPFLKGPASELAGRTSDNLIVWNSPRPSIFEAVVAASELDNKVHLVEDFLLASLEPNRIDRSDRLIIQLADAVQQEPSEPFAALRDRIPLGNRQFERRFKALIGINLRTYVRICRFAHVKTSLLLSPTPSLTQLGYDAGYFDQAHFSRDFAALAEQPPKRFPAHYPLHRLISERKD